MRSLFLLWTAGWLLCLSCRQNHESRASRQDRLFRENAPKVLGEIKSMLDRDQEIRRLQYYGTLDTRYIDSLIAAYAARKEDLESLLLINDTLLVSTRFRDSIQALMKEQDERHTKRMIALINQYGYPESDRIDSTIHISPFLLLHHPSALYKDTVLRLLTTELRLRRIDTVSYEMIKWTLNGREGLPAINGMKVERNADGTTSITL